MPHAILVIDDDPLIRDFVDLVLSQAGHRVSAAPNGTIGLETLGHVRADLILLDIQMPGMSGLEVLRILRKHRRLRTPVMMITARGDIDTVKQALNEGANGFIVKPFTPTDLMKRISALLAPEPRAVVPPAPPVAPKPATPPPPSAPDTFEID
ncbi:response regulator transcription factor [Caulobacter hibisci]|uniref:Response regulator transcription factor n=1 Tax=Caulobacter hibisci TaxID=2035993 RepID=A0ABS0SYG1_9CAUL|nr:response regulator transcription factor [Caulobacter hibisci]MBI1684663.1 response regulator transcription factor [Caulobacter hibisci]